MRPALLVGALALLAPWVLPAPGSAVAVLWIVVALAAGVFLWRGEALEPVQERGGWGWLAAIVLLGTLLRVVALDDYPAWTDFDEAQNGVFAGDLTRAWSTEGYLALMPPGHGHGTETGFFYLIAACFRLFGVSFFSLRLPGVVCGVLTLVALFAFLRELFGRRVALVGAGLAALAPWLVVMSRVPKHSLALPVCLMFGLCFALRALEDPRRRTFFAAGLCFGLGLHSYPAMRHVLLVVLLWMGYVGWRESLSLRRVGWLLAGWLLPAAPVLVAAAQDPGGYFAPMLLHEPSADGAVTRIARGLGDLVLTRGSYRGSYESVAPSAAFGVLLLAGAPLLARWRDRRFALLALLFLAMAPLFTVSRWNLTRPRHFVGVLPVYFGLIALVGVVVFDRLRAAVPRATVALWTLMALGGVGLVAEGIAELRSYPPGCPEARREAVLRGALAAAGQGRTVCLAEGFALDWYPWRYYYEHPGVVRVEANALPALLTRDRDLLVVDEPAGLGRAAVALGGSFAPMPLPPSNGGGDAGAYLVSRRVAAPGRDAWLYLPRGGPWRFSAEVAIDGTRLPAGEWTPRSAGLLRLAGALDRLRWQGPGDPGLHAIPPGHWWPASTRPGVFASALLTQREVGWRADRERDLPRRGIARAQRVFAMIAAPGGMEVLSCQIADEGGRRLRVDLRHLDADGREREGPALDPPVEHVLPEGRERHLEFLPPRAFGLARLTDGARVVLARLARTVWLYRGGARRAVGRWADPIDVVALADGGFAVADTDGRVCRFAADGTLRHTARHGRPVALAERDAKLLVLDARGLVLVDRDRRVPALLAGDASRLTTGPDGALLLIAPAARRIRCYDAKLAPLRLARMDPFEMPPRDELPAIGLPRRVAAVAFANQVWVALDEGRLLRFVRGVTERHPLTLGPPDAGASRHEWELQLPDAGRWEVWVELATPSTVTVEVALDHAPWGRQDAAPAGWLRLASGFAAPGPHRLTLQAHGGALPRIARVTLVRR